MWDGLFTCEAEDGTILADELAEDMTRPIIALALEQEQGKSKEEGVNLAVVNLAGSTAHLTWYDSSWGLQSAELALEPKFADPNWGSDQETIPDALELVWMPFDWSNTADDFWLHIRVTDDHKKSPSTEDYPTVYRETHHSYSLAY